MKWRELHSLEQIGEKDNGGAESMREDEPRIGGP